MGCGHSITRDMRRFFSYVGWDAVPTVCPVGRATEGRRLPPGRPSWPLPQPAGPRGVNGVTFLVPQELNASRPATPKMDSARMTMFAGNGAAPQRQRVGGPGQNSGES